MVSQEIPIQPKDNLVRVKIEEVDESNDGVNKENLLWIMNKDLEMNK